MLRRAQALWIALALLATGTLAVARDARVQQARVRLFKACVLLVPDMRVPDPEATLPQRSPNPNPYLFYVLNNRPDLRPDGWRIHNPASPAFANAAQSLRWQRITGMGGALPQGTPLREDVGAYWEVVLSEANMPRLLQMDVIYLPIAPLIPAASPFTLFTEGQRQMLARLADAGVTIWVDWARQGPTLASAMGGPNLATSVRNPFFTNLDFAGYGGTATSPSVGHPLLAGQHVLRPGESVRLGAPYGGVGSQPSQDRALNLRPEFQQPTANFAVVVPLSAATQGGAYVAAARYGAGFVVGSAGNIGGAISTQGDGGNAGQPLLPIIPSNAVRAGNADLSLAEPEDLKFAYNVFAWASESTGPGRNSRHTADSNVLLNGVMEQGSYPHLVPAGPGLPWRTYPLSGTPVANLPQAPVSPLYVNGTIIAATRYYNGTVVNELNVFDANPGEDFNGDGSQDDPVDINTPASFNSPMADLAIGLPYDRIMGATVPGNGLITGMTLGEVPESLANSTQQAKAFLFAAGTTGLFSLPAPRPGLPAADYWDVVAPGVAPSVGVQYTGAPAFYNLPGTGAGAVDSHLYAGGVAATPAFGSAGNGKLVGFRVTPSGSTADMTPEWAYPPQQESNRMGAVSGPITVAQVQDQGTGAIDTIVFVTSVYSGDPTGGQEAGGAGDTTGKVEGFLVATRGDVLGFPRGQGPPGGTTPNAGRRFASVRWMDVQPGVGQVPQTVELIWDPNHHYEVRVLNKDTGYVVRRFVPGTAGFQLLRDGTAGQVELPRPPTAFAAPGQPEVWDLNRFVLVADYTPLPINVDTTGPATLRPRFTPATPYVRTAQNTIQPTGIAGGVTVGRDGLIYYGTGIGYMCAAEWRKGRAQFRWKMRSLEYNAAGGASQDVNPDSPTYLQDYAFTAAPAAGNQVVFASRQGAGGAPGTTYVLDSNAVIRFKLGWSGPLSPAQAQDILLEADHGLGLPQNAPFLAANQQPWGRLPGQFSVDPDTATVTFHNMENFSLDLSQARSPSELVGIAETGGRPAVPIRWAFRNPGPGQPSQADPATAWIPLPLTAIYRAESAVIDRWVSSPVLAGGKIYLMGQAGFLHELPADPRRVEARFPRPAAGLLGFNLDSYGFALRRIYNAGGGLAEGAVPSPLVGPGLLAANTRRGLVFYGTPNVVIADADRIVEASGDSTALASTGAVTRRRIDLSEFAIPTDPSFANTGNRPILTERQLLNRPSKVLKLNRLSSLTSLFASGNPQLPAVDAPNAITETSEMAEESYLAADTGNNRCVEFNPAGNVVWELRDFQDPYKLLPPGEPLHLSGPMDVQRWVETENHPTLGRLQVIHTLVADTGNFRVLEIVDKVLPQRGIFNANSFPVTLDQPGVDGEPIRWHHVLVWCSATNAQGLRLRYRTAQRVYWPNADGSLIPTGAGPGGAAVSFFPGDPALPPEPFLSYTMVSVGNQRVSYPEGIPTVNVGYVRRHVPSLPLNQAALSVAERRPGVREGGDTIAFLRGRWYLEEGAFSLGVSPLREPLVDAGGAPLAGIDRYRWSRGVIDPVLPTISEIYDELGATGSLGRVVHRLQGIQSIQRTIRADVRFAPELLGAGIRPYAHFFLVADAQGVWEIRLVPPGGVNGPEMRPRLAWAFTEVDYAYATGAGNGNPLLVYSPVPANQTPGGRRLVPASARRITGGLVLITSRPPSSDSPPPAVAATSAFRQLFAGGDVFLLRATDYRPAQERGGAPYDRANLMLAGNNLHGWQPDLWVQSVFAANVPPAFRGAPSIRWRAAEALDTTQPPYRPLQLGGVAGSPYELTGTYLPVSPAYADLVP